MRSKLLYESVEKRLEKLSGVKLSHENIFDKFLQDHRGEPATVLLRSGEKISVILLCGSKNVIGVRRFSRMERLIIRSKEVVGVAIAVKKW